MINVTMIQLTIWILLVSDNFFFKKKGLMQPYIWPKMNIFQFLRHLFRRPLFATIATVKLRIPEFYTTLMVSN